MYFDLFYELSVPKFRNKSEFEIYHEALNEIIHAESCGFHTAWLVEHHFMQEYSHSSAPFLYLAALAQKTTRLKMGLGITPLTYHHPIHVAENVATLDILSEGRVEFGIGRGFSPKEYDVFNIDMAASRNITEESLTIIQKAWYEEKFDYKGQYFDLKDISVFPKPVQDTIPLWSAAASPESFQFAAEKGLGVLIGPFKPWFMIEQDIKQFHKLWNKYQPNTKPKIAMTIGMLCLEDRQRAKTIAKPLLEWFYSILIKQTLPVLEKLYDSYEYYRRFSHFRQLLSFGISYPI